MINPQHEGWQEIRSCSDLCERFPERVRGWFHALDLGRAGLERVQKAVTSERLVDACEALIDYVRGNGAGAWMRSGSADRVSSGADDVLRDVFTIQGVTDTVPRNVDGGIDWYHRGPRDDHEYALLFNRHGYFEALLRAWWATGEAKYPERFDLLVRDWILHNPKPAERTREPNWRPLEVGLRSGYSWPHSLFGFFETPEVTDAARVMMVGSLGDHAAYLQKHWAHSNPNITLMELNGLGTVAMLFPEFRAARMWLTTSLVAMMTQLGQQVYPDGAQNELTAGYHEVARRHFEHFAQTLELTGHPVPELFRSTLASMWFYTSGVLRPDGHIPKNNDSDRHAKRDEVRIAADTYDRPDWAYIATNGSEGEAPAGVPSRIFPWAGHLVSRSGWDADAHWSFFDFGPWGASHQHNDKLHLSVTAYGRDILVDSGRFAYGGVVGQKFRRPYATHSRAHNLILVDGTGQGPGPRTVDTPVDEADYGVFETYDTARGSFDAFPEIDGAFAHHRTVVYVRGRFWVVVDRLTTDRPRGIEALWHFHPDCTVVADGRSVRSTDAGKGNVRIDALAGVAWDISVVKGQEEPEIQGWYSEVYNDVQESACACCRGHIAQDEMAVWLITPSRGEGTACSAEVVASDAAHTIVDVDGTRVTVPRDEEPVTVEIRS